MRIIGGEHRGRRLKSLDRRGLRPTTDRVRESIFNLLASRVELEGASVLDLFAGTGALGLEALSRGAASCRFVERDRRSAAVIQENAAMLCAEDRTRVVVADVMNVLRSLEHHYDLIFADPPYAAPVFARLVDDVFARAILAPEGIFVLEHAGAMHPTTPTQARVVVARSFGDSAVTCFGWNDQHEDAHRS